VYRSNPVVLASVCCLMLSESLDPIYTQRLWKAEY
jgi:hypothetical protein